MIGSNVESPQLRETGVLTALILAAAAVTCSNPDTPQGSREIANGAVPCRQAPPQARFKPRPVTPAEQVEIKRKADLLLFDGLSARWQWPKRRSAAVYCGFINAKNRMGAFTGWTPFYVFENEFRIIGEGDSRVMFEALCGASGYPLSIDELVD